ncbi:bacitracin ABC transporter ATP-binding protein [Lysobacter arseniciresistens ZS79]|uniref:Bacitracin ABC transporter ATP-binding protein n=1 Tax=Lysobacter arseniciresistens ZS79 TaxID=913325 RepID=A0A0A0F3Y7_9GAMM|nr:ATP-binding cassette domain-containing protein [Lysobacter arseniciresistens]KGM57544.1 bacitracin ABC transporter ATP-binding protein [Lysobacter arseniciresistens ZS79]
MTLAIQTTHLRRGFPGGQGVFDLNLAVPAGIVYGFLGPNGAGKTTTIRLLLGLLRPDGGVIRLHGQTLDRGNRRVLEGVGALVDSPSLYPHLSGRQNLEVTRRLLGCPRARIDEVLAITGIARAAARRVREYSLGMRQRLAIALALLGRPRLLILDEPANGLDPAGILDMRRLLRRLAVEHGICVFVSSHQLGEVEQVASHVGVLHGGRLRFQGSIAELHARYSPVVRLHCDDPARAVAVLQAAGEDVNHVEPGALGVRLRARAEAELNRMLVEAGIAVSHLALQRPSLESLFFELTREAEVAT